MPEPSRREPRILLWDVESSPSLGWVWNKWQTNVIAFEEDWYLLSIAWKFLGDKNVQVKGLDDFPDYHTHPQTDKQLVEIARDLFDESDIVVGHNCVAATTVILTADLRWVAAGDLRPGDELVAFNEGRSPLNPARHTASVGRRLQKSYVTHNVVVRRQCVRVIFDNGDEVITTPEHPWLKLAARAGEYRWAETQHLAPGQRVRKFLTPWQEDRSYEAGWLSGFISGEGSLSRNPHSIAGIAFCQRPGTTWDQALAYCQVVDVPIGKVRYPKTGGLGRQDTLYTYSTGGWPAVFTILGRLRIQRLIDNINWDNLPTLSAHEVPTPRIVAVEPAGIHEVALLGTSTRTYFGAGYPMHNSNAFDNKKLHTRMLVHELPPPSSYQEVDTLKIARAKFSFTSNSLNDLCQALGIGRKLPVGTFATWRGCMEGDPVAWKRMKKYNANDVVLLEGLYKTLFPWSPKSGTPNVATMAGIPQACPRCGSEAGMIIRGYVFTGVSRATKVQCKHCFGYSRHRQLERMEPTYVPA